MAGTYRPGEHGTQPIGGQGKLAHAAFHCHAPTCLSMAMYRCPPHAPAANCTAATPGVELLCREEPVYGGTGAVRQTSSPLVVLQASSGVPFAHAYTSVDRHAGAWQWLLSVT